MHHIIDNFKLYELIETNQIDDIDLLHRLDENIVDHYHNIIIDDLSPQTIDEMNEQFNLLHSILIEANLGCNVKTCSSKQRNHWIRENIQIPKNQSLRNKAFQFYTDLLDTMHCCFIHSLNLGMRVKSSKYYEYNALGLEICAIFFNRYLFEYVSSLHSNTRKLRQI